MVIFPDSMIMELITNGRVLSGGVVVHGMMGGASLGGLIPYVLHESASSDTGSSRTEQAEPAT
jgi:hypothetical protein